MQIFREIHPLKAFLVEKRLLRKTIGFVPTMGALHAGHLSLVTASKNENPVTVCSIFVNPAQFNNPTDFKKYPQTPEQDVALLEKAGCDVLFIPETQAMYGPADVLRFDFGDLDKIMEGKFRPGHFSGVGLVVSKLFNMVTPDVAYFGQKDWQQFTIIRHLVNELKFNVQVKSVSTVREPDGLAMSSRNMRLSPSQRKKAVVLYTALTQAKVLLRNGSPLDEVKEKVQRMVEEDPEVKLEYFEMASSENLKLLKNVDESAKPILCIAATVSEVRLIDNMFLSR